MLAPSLCQGKLMFLAGELLKTSVLSVSPWIQSVKIRHPYSQALLREPTFLKSKYNITAARRKRQVNTGSG
jgi:hypothetical protein